MNQHTIRDDDPSIWDDAFEDATFTPAKQTSPKTSETTAPQQATPATTEGQAKTDEAQATDGTAGDGKKKKKREDTVETYWAEHVKNMPWGIFYEDGKVPVSYKWNGKYWTTMTADDIENEAERFLFTRFKTDYTNARKRSCVELASSIMNRNAKVLTPLTNRDIFSVRGGFLEVLVDGSIKWMPHDKSLFVRNYIDVPIYKNLCDPRGFYTPAKQEDIEARGLLGQLIRNSFADLDVRRAFQEHVGDTLLYANRQRTPFLLGSGGQGKSQWIVLLKGMHKNHAVADLSNLKGFAMASFIGCSLLVVDEAEKRIDEQAFKRIFGGGAGVQVDRKFKDAISWTPDIKGICALNEMPVFAEHSEALLRRIDPYPMTKAMHNSKDRVTDIGKKILDGYKKAGTKKGEEILVPDQRKDFLDWLLNGAVRVVLRGDLIPEEEMPQACRIEKQILRGETEPVFAFIEDLEWAPVKGGKGGVTKAEIYDVYVSWCKDNGRTGIMSSHRFGKDLKRNIEKIHGQGSLRESKMAVNVQVSGSNPPRYEKAQKMCYRLVASNGAEYGVRYGDYVWNDEAQVETAQPAPPASPASPAPSAPVKAYKPEPKKASDISLTTGHKVWCKSNRCSGECLKYPSASDMPPFPEVAPTTLDDDIPF